MEQMLVEMEQEESGIYDNLNHVSTIYGKIPGEGTVDFAKHEYGVIPEGGEEDDPPVLYDTVEASTPRYLLSNDAYSTKQQMKEVYASLSFLNVGSSKDDDAELLYSDLSAVLSPTDHQWTSDDWKDLSSEVKENRRSSVVLGDQVPKSAADVPDYLGKELLLGTRCSRLNDDMSYSEMVKELRIRKMALCGQIGLLSKSPDNPAVAASLRGQLSALDERIAQYTARGSQTPVPLISLSELSRSLSKRVKRKLETAVKEVRKGSRLVPKGRAASADGEAPAEPAAANSSSSALSKSEAIASIRTLCHELVLSVSRTLKSDSLTTSLVAYTKGLEDALRTVLALGAICRTLLPLFSADQEKMQLLHSVTTVRRASLFCLRVSKDLRKSALHGSSSAIESTRSQQQRKNRENAAKALAGSVRNVLAQVVKINL